VTRSGRIAERYRSAALGGSFRLLEPGEYGEDAAVVVGLGRSVSFVKIAEMCDSTILSLNAARSG
jgi:hypothetical protein